MNTTRIHKIDCFVLDYAVAIRFSASPGLLIATTWMVSCVVLLDLNTREMQQGRPAALACQNYTAVHRSLL
jgi:hypothetical protein